MSLSHTVLKILNYVKKLVAVLAKFKNAINEDSKTLIIVVAFIGWIAVSNYKDKHGKVEVPMVANNVDNVVNVNNIDNSI
jgi:hypothetical protein